MNKLILVVLVLVQAAWVDAETAESELEAPVLVVQEVPIIVEDGLFKVKIGEEIWGYDSLPRAQEAARSAGIINRADSRQGEWDAMVRDLRLGELELLALSWSNPGPMDMHSIAG